MWRGLAWVLLAGLSGCVHPPAPAWYEAMGRDSVGMTPEEIAEALSGPPHEVLVSSVWKRLGVDPSGYEFVDDQAVHEYAAQEIEWAREYPRQYEDLIERCGSLLDHLIHEGRRNAAFRCVVAHTDFKNGGEADAFVLVHQGWGSHWLVLSQPQEGEWRCLGMVGRLLVEGEFRPDPEKPRLPGVNHLRGRTLLTVMNGGNLGWETPDRTIEKLVYLIDDERMTLLWQEGLPTVGMVIEFEDCGEDGIGMVVRSEEGHDWSMRTYPVPPLRRYRLAPGATELELVSEEPVD